MIKLTKLIIFLYIWFIKSNNLIMDDESMMDKSKNDPKKGSDSNESSE